MSVRAGSLLWLQLPQDLCFAEPFVLCAVDNLLRPGDELSFAVVFTTGSFLVCRRHTTPARSLATKNPFGHCTICFPQVAAAFLVVVLRAAFPI